jgi:hypothetical protein
MAPLHKGKHGGPPHDHAKNRAYNTPENAMRAVATCRACLKNLIAGKAWSDRAPHGEYEIKGVLMLEDKAVSLLHFSPEDGSLLPKGLHAMSGGKSDVLGVVQARLKKIPQEISVLEGAEFREPESCWAVPIAHQGRIVGHLKVSADSNSILADRKATDELEELDEGP